jgi:hypothetical protein
MGVAFGATLPVPVVRFMRKRLSHYLALTAISSSITFILSIVVGVL